MPGRRWWLVALNVAALAFTVAVQLLYYLPAMLERLIEGPLAGLRPLWYWMAADAHPVLWVPPVLLLLGLVAIPETRRVAYRVLVTVVLWGGLAVLAALLLGALAWVAWTLWSLRAA